MTKEKKLRTVGTLNARSFSVNLDEVELPSGRVTKRLRVEHPDAAAIIPLLDDNRVMLVRQFRYSINEETLEIPAGEIDPGETAEECIRREFEEETGHKVESVQPLLTYIPAIGYSNEILYIFTGTGISKQTDYKVSSDEISSIVILTLDEIKSYIREGKIKDGKTLIAFSALLCDLFKKN
ncbi:MAG: NUDIX hydrolase [Candidatus Hodarchaeales archaeon]